MGTNQLAGRHNIHQVQGKWIDVMERADWRANKTAGWAVDRAN